MTNKTNRLLVLIVAMQGLVLAGQWVNVGYTSTAHAQVPDAGAQRVQVIEELRSMNTKLDRVTELLASGKLQVRTVSSEAPKDAR